MVANQKGTWQCHGMAMGLSKEGPNGRGWPIGIAIQKAPGKAMAWPCEWEGAMQAPWKSLAHGIANQKAPGNPMAWP